MSRDRKRVFKSASIVEYKSLERYFEEMALKGWLIKKMGFGMTFRKIEPQALTFNVAMLTPKTMLDWPDQDESTTYDEFCKSAGWQLAAENQIYRIYYHSSEVDASPIYTDDEDIYKTVKKAFLKSEFILMFLPFLYLAMALLNAKNIRYDLFTSNLKVFNLFSPYVITIIIWMATIPSLYWIIINGKRLHNGDTLFYYSPKWVKNKYRLQSVILVGYLLLLIVALFFDPYGDIPMSMIVVSILPLVLIYIFVWLFKKYIQKTSYPLIAKIGILVIAWALSMGIGMVAIFTFVGTNFMSTPDKKDVKMEINRLTLEELGVTGISNLEWWHMSSSVFVPLSYEYDEWIEDDENKITNSIHIEAMHIDHEWLKSWVVEKVLNEERERYLEEIQYKPNMENYVKEIQGYEDFGVRLYNLSDHGYKVMVVKDQNIFLISYSDLLEDNNLEKALEGLFEISKGGR